MKKKFYVTTPIYYVNDIPHIGHAYTTVAADVLARYNRLKGHSVFFLTGTDEHGNKIAQAAKKEGISPAELAGRMASRFKNLWKNLNISYNDFIRTTEPRHTKVARTIFKRLYEQNDIYKGTYKGWYCTPCESFWLESQLKQEKFCPECAREVQKIEEESYLLRLSKYEKPLLKYFEAHPSFVLPATRRNEVVQFIKGGLKDISFTRLRLDWGIPCPIEEKHSIYVWVDALINYISALGYTLEGERFSAYWPADVHLIGKDILRFHAVIWPAILMALGIELPRMVFAHGWWKLKGEKMSKSKGIVIDPEQIVSEYGADSLRYFLLREVPFGEDGNFSTSLFIKRVNSDLANDLGNLLNRTIPLVIRYCQGKVPPFYRDGGELKEKIEKVFSELDSAMNVLAFSKALSSIWEIVKLSNLYIDKNAPWQLAKEENKQKELHNILYNLLETLRILALILFPFIPDSAQKIWTQLGIEGNIESQIVDKAIIWGQLKPGTKVKEGPPLFPRIQESVKKGKRGQAT
ncbi:hypothetical protein LCGC14_2229960, partial [marine sediment metagenome]